MDGSNFRKVILMWLNCYLIQYYKNTHSDGDDPILGNSDATLIEPGCTEFISALAAGGKSRLLIHVVSSAGDGSSLPLTAALAVAAKQTGGRLICILPQNGDVSCGQYSQVRHRHWCGGGGDLNLNDCVEFVAAGNPCEAVQRYKKIDFAVIDAPGDGMDHARLLKSMDVNRKGCVLVAIQNALSRARGVSCGEIVGGESVILPIGGGVELTKIGFGCKQGMGRRFKRFHVTFEN